MSISRGACEYEHCTQCCCTYPTSPPTKIFGYHFRPSASFTCAGVNEST
jgi:hypothetical protein